MRTIALVPEMRTTTPMRRLMWICVQSRVMSARSFIPLSHVAEYTGLPATVRRKRSRSALGVR